MKDNENKSLPPGCHQEHLQVLNSLTESLKDELKRGLTLLDGCVNQLAQAKWILINVERTIENYYAECPACDKDSTALPVGNRATTPPTILNSQAPSTSNASKKVRENKAKKASVLPMVSGHTVQRPKINIARVDVRKEKKPKKEKEPTSLSRVRSRGSGATVLALASASTSSGRPVVDSGDEAPRNGIQGTSPAKKKPGPMSKTRIKSDGPPEFTYDGICVSVDLDDVNELLSGQSCFQGTELNKFLKLVGLPPVKEKKQPKSSKSEKEKPSTSRPPVVEEPVKKRKYGSDDSNASEDERTKKKLDDNKLTSKESTETSKSSVVPKLNIPLNLNSAIKSKFLAFAAGKIKAKVGSGADSKTDTTGEASKESSRSVRAASANSVSVKAEVDISDSESESKHSNKRPSNKKSKQDSDGDTYSPKNKKPKQSRRSSLRNTSSDESEAEKSSKTSKKITKPNKKISSDDSDYELSSPTSKKRGTTTRVGGRRGSKTISKETVSSDSDDDSSIVSNKKKQASRSRKTSRDESSDEHPAKVITKSAERRPSKGEQQNKRLMSSPERPSNEGSKVNDSVSDEPKPKPRPGPASSKAKRTGGRPGPLSAKLKAEKEKQQTEKRSVDNSSDDDGKNKSSKSDPKPQAMFTDSDSNDSELVKIKKKIPLDLQDAVRSPSPQSPRDIFTNLLASYNKISDSSETPLEKLKKQSKYVKQYIFELKESVAKKLTKVGRELVPYTGPFDADDSVFTSGKYYIVGKPNEEKLVLFESEELQELDLSMEDVNDIATDR
ncbi:unnamed protein product [Allacma fusca]|uniref:Uncharacterized protein n=1 Tax=Allacma fusca TaxID=39272 RepID=A0A8J2J4E1_9HEXA|nr:unnamed protein product [Allacma fusca]